MKKNLARKVAVAPSSQVGTADAILRGIADLDLFMAHDIRKLLESGPAIPPPNPSVQAYQPTRTSVTSS